MAELKHGSLLFSLEAWATRERERLLRAQAEAERSLALERAERAALEGHELRRELARAIEREHAARAETRRLALTIERLEALRRLELARTRLEAESRAALELDALKRHHERRLETIRASTQRFRERVVIGALALVLALLATGSALMAALPP